MTAGEHWARDQLLALRAAGFDHAAWRRFLAASFDRAAATRRERPALARQARTWSAVVLLAGHGVRRAARRPGLSVPAASTWTGWSLATAVMLDWHLGMVEGAHGEPRGRLGGADALTLLRLALAPFVASATTGLPFAALIATAGATDILDGRLARNTGATRLGRDLDRVADVALKLAAARAGRRARWLSPTAASLLAGSQIAGVALFATAYFRTGRAPALGGLRSLHRTGPPLLAGLALAPRRPRAADRMVAGTSLAVLIIGVTRQVTVTRREHHVVGLPRRWQRRAAAHPRLAQPQPRRPGRPRRAVPDDHVRRLAADPQRARGDGGDRLARE
jgi:hypothetical protein